MYLKMGNRYENLWKFLKLPNRSFLPLKVLKKVSYVYICVYYSSFQVKPLPHSDFI